MNKKQLIDQAVQHIEEFLHSYAKEKGGMFHYVPVSYDEETKTELNDDIKVFLSQQIESAYDKGREDGEISRQRRWQLKKAKEGKCHICGKPIPCHNHRGRAKCIKGHSPFQTADGKTRCNVCFKFL
jgi:hypothetical protein